MIKLFVKVAGDMQSYETTYYATEATPELVEALRKELVAVLPKSTVKNKVGPVLALIDPRVNKYDQFTLGF